MNIYHAYAHVVRTTAKKVISRHRKNENVFKMSKDEKCTCKACKNTVFHCQICKFVGFLLPLSSWLLKLPSLAPHEELIVFAYQIWNPQFLSVVQFPFDNCHSPFSPKTFFEIGVCTSVEREIPERNLPKIHENLFPTVNFKIQSRENFFPRSAEKRQSAQLNPRENFEPHGIQPQAYVTLSRVCNHS